MTIILVAEHQYRKRSPVFMVMDSITSLIMLFHESYIIYMVYNLVRFSAEIRGKHADIGSFNDSHSTPNPSVASRKSFDENSHGRFAKPVSDKTADNTCLASSDSDEAVLPPSFPSESKNPFFNEVKDSSSSRRSKKNVSNTADETGFKSKLPRAKSEKSHDVVANSGGHEHRRKVASVEKSTPDTSKSRTLPSLSNSSTHDEAADVEESHLSKYKEARRSSSCSRDRIFSTTTKTDNYRTLPSKVSAVPNLPQNVRNGLKTSMQKVVQQFKSSKDSRSSLASVENEVVAIFALFLYQITIIFISIISISIIIKY